MQEKSEKVGRCVCDTLLPKWIINPTSLKYGSAHLNRVTEYQVFLPRLDLEETKLEAFDWQEKYLKTDVSKLGAPRFSSNEANIA